MTVTEYQFALEGIVPGVQLIPSADEAVIFELVAMATKTPVLGFTVTEIQSELEGIVTGVQLIPSVDEAAIREP